RTCMSGAATGTTRRVAPRAAARGGMPSTSRAVRRGDRSARSSDTRTTDFAWPGLRIDSQPESILHFPPAVCGDAQRARVEVLPHPLAFQRNRQDRRTERTTDVRLTLAPVETGVGESAAEISNLFHVHIKPFERRGPGLA